MNPQVPLLHDAVALPTLVVHFFPHAPQLFVSVCSSTHDPLQFDWPDAQPDTHVDPEQAGVPASGRHLSPHAPQLFVSLVRSTQAPLHSV